MAGERTSDWVFGDQSKSGGGGGSSEVNAASLTFGDHSRDRGGGGEVNAASLTFGDHSRNRGGGGGGGRMSAVDLTVGRRGGREKKPAGSWFDGLFTRPADQVGKKAPKAPRARPDPTPREPKPTLRERISKRLSTTDFTPVGDPAAFDQSKTGLQGRHSAVENFVRNRHDKGRTISPAIREAWGQGRLPDQRDANQSPIDEDRPRRFFGRSGAVVTGMALLRMAAGADQGSENTDHSIPNASEMAGGPSAIGFAETSNLSLVAEPPRELGALTISAVEINMPSRDLAA